jgi:dihydroorotase
MKILIRSAKITDKNSDKNEQTVDLLIEDGIITEIGKISSQTTADQVIEDANLCISPGWFDMQVNFKDPGFEYKEDLKSGAKAAAQGGFTGVGVMPSTLPPVHSKSEIEYIKNKSRGNIVDIFPFGTISHNLEGKDLSEMYDMYLSGAVAFSDDKKPITDPGLMQRALLYTKSFNGLVISYPEDKKIALDGRVNEGITSTLTGLKGIPALAEELVVQRDIFLAEYTEARVHFSTISTAKSVELVRNAKKKGLKISAGVSVNNLFFDDSVLSGFDSNFKVKPPLRINSDIEALVEGLIDGTIDVIVSDHSPEDEEMKKREFDYAAFGAIGLESAFGALNKILSGKMNTSDIIEKITINPRQLLGLNTPKISVGEKANITLFKNQIDWEFSFSHIKSKSKNSPYIGNSLKGKPFAVINNAQVVYCN